MIRKDKKLQARQVKILLLGQLPLLPRIDCIHGEDFI